MSGLDIYTHDEFWISQNNYFHPIDILYLEFVHCRNVTSPQLQSRMFMIQDLCGTAINVPRASRKWLVIKIPLNSHCWYWSCQKFYTIYFCEITVETACSWIMNNMTIINYPVIKAMEWHFLAKKKDWLSKIYIRWCHVMRLTVPLYMYMYICW